MLTFAHSETLKWNYSDGCLKNDMLLKTYTPRKISILFMNRSIRHRFLFHFAAVVLLLYFKIISAQSVGGTKTEEHRENHLTHPQAELDLSHMWPERGLEPTPDTAVK